jgi:UDP-N-acetylmuramoyl-L-alanyl-D-glutamate--2,6-diaminopimelate ligase
MGSYFKAKLKIFDLLSLNGKNKRIAVINADIDKFEGIKSYLKRFDNLMTRTFSISGRESDYPVTVKDMTPSGSEFILADFHVRISMIGITNLYNFALASVLLMELGFSLEIFGAMLYSIRVRGRMESIPAKRGFSVVIDYAHKPDALEKLLMTVRDVVKKKGKIITVLGAGGDRDRTKRPLMGRIAGSMSDRVFITSDNPRTEDPFSIIRGLEQGLKETGNCLYTVEADRAKAIKLALQNAKYGDIVVIAGKGHEEYQIRGKKKVHFSDREEVEKYLLNTGDGIAS